MGCGEVKWRAVCPPSAWRLTGGEWDIEPPPWPSEDIDVACFKVGGRRGIVVAVWVALWVALAAAVVGLTGAAAELSAAPSAADAEFFESRVRPLLLEHCSACHSRAAGEPEGNLSFDTRAETLGHEGLATPGKPEQSLLVEVVRYDGKLQMPPDGRLPPEAIATLEEWVRRGLPWPVEGAVEAGATIVERGDRACDLYIVCRGALEALGAAGERLGTVKEGECFGEMALLLSQPRSATVRAVAHCDLLVLAAEDFRRIIADFRANGGGSAHPSRERRCSC